MRRETAGILVLFVLLFALVLLVYQVQKPQETRIRAQTIGCSPLTYPCQEGQILFPQDEGKHDKQTEWWYANFHTDTTSIGVALSGVLALVRVRQPDGSDRGWALFEATAKSPTQKFDYRISEGTITASANLQNVTFTAGPGSQVTSAKFYQDGSPFRYKVEVVGDGINVNLILTAAKKPLVEGGTGYVPIFPSNPTDPAYYSGYYSLTNLSSVSNGNIILPGAPPFTASGIGWIDHQWFNTPFSSDYLTSTFGLTAKPGHEWFSIQLDNNVQIVAWNIFKEPSSSSFVLKDLDIINASGNQVHYDNVIIDPKSYWKAPDAKVYAASWRIYKDNEFDLTITTSVQNQYVPEAKTYEGASSVLGTYKGTSVKGRGYAEMTLTYFNSPCDPLVEICDLKDNDCDYRIDEVCQPPTPTPTPSSNTAVYDSALRAPKCASIGSFCDSGTLLNGRNGLGPEPNAPNTINSSCSDGTYGTYHVDESIDKLKVSTTDGSVLAPGKTAKIEATLWVWGYSSDYLDLYYANNANSPTWTFLTTLKPSANGSQILTTTYTLPSGSLQAIRGNFRYNGITSSCSTGSYNDHDDLIFVTQG